MSRIEALAKIRAARAARMLRRPKNPADLARRLDPKFRVTPAIRLLSNEFRRWIKEPDQRDVLSTPPRTGKSQLAVWAVVWALGEDPDLEIVIISNGDDLAKEHSSKVRDIINEHHEFLGYRIAPDKTAVGRWRVDGRKGGMLAAGINSHIVGFGADLMILDDIVGGAAEADSEAHRKKILNEYQGSLATRIHPGGSCMIVMTRWHEEDLAGSVIANEPGRWNVTNIPAVARRGVPDALDRQPGEVMVSALGYTPVHYADLRRTVGERVWHSQFMGMPSTPEGSLVRRAWLDGWRMPCAPANPVMTVIGVDPSDSGKGDKCGLVAASRTRENVVALIADRSKQMTSDEWAVAAVQLASEVGASQIAIEGFSARETYTTLVRNAINRAQEKGTLRHPIKVTSWPEKGKPRPGDAFARAAGLLQALEVGTARMGGQHPTFEDEAVLWQAGQHQPDSLAAFVVAQDVLMTAIGKQWQIGSPIDAAAAGNVGGATITALPTAQAGVPWWDRQYG